MPRFDTAGPMGLDPGTGGEQGSGGGQRGGQGQGGRGRDGGGGRGPGGNCICPGCGAQIAHRQGIPCTQEKCPECGSQMTREM